jgi:O-methyltransferase
MNPLMKQFVRAGLHLAHKVLPQAMYDRFYSIGFNVYKKRVRSKYYRKVIEARSRGNADATRRAEWVHSVMPHSLVGSSGLERTYDLAQAAVDENLLGAFVECGVAQGGCAALIARVAAAEGSRRHCWFFDSYEGLPDPTGDDYATGRTGEHVRPLPRGACLGSYEQVDELLFGQFRLSRDDISLVKGWFQDTLPKTRQRIGPIALLRLDGDWYESTKCCLESLYDQVVENGFLIIDDYYSCYGARKATDEFRAREGIDTEIESDGRGGCSFRKPCLVAVGA